MKSKIEILKNISKVMCHRWPNEENTKCPRAQLKTKYVILNKLKLAEFIRWQQIRVYHKARKTKQSKKGHSFNCLSTKLLIMSFKTANFFPSYYFIHYNLTIPNFGFEPVQDLKLPFWAAGFELATTHSKSVLKNNMEELKLGSTTLQLLAKSCFEYI